jgi:hypothetical protein
VKRRPPYLVREAIGFEAVPDRNTGRLPIEPAVAGPDAQAQQ